MLDKDRVHRIQDQLDRLPDDYHVADVSVVGLKPMIEQAYRPYLGVAVYDGEAWNPRDSSQGQQVAMALRAAGEEVKS